MRLAEMQRECFSNGETIFVQNDPSNSAYLILSGSVDIHVEEDGRRAFVTTLKPGDVLGEMGLITDKPRSATATAHDDCALMRLDSEEFFRLLDEHPQEIMDYVKALIGRLKNLNSRLLEPELKRPTRAYFKT
jgi:CRP-like cAMP-binding protein